MPSLLHERGTSKRCGTLEHARGCAFEVLPVAIETPPEKGKPLSGVVGSRFAICGLTRKFICPPPLWGRARGGCPRRKIGPEISNRDTTVFISRPSAGSARFEARDPLRSRPTDGDRTRTGHPVPLVGVIVVEAVVRVAGDQGKADGTHAWTLTRPPMRVHSPRGCVPRRIRLWSKAVLLIPG